MFKLVKVILSTLLSIKNLWLFMKQEQYEPITESWKISIEAQHCQRQVGSAPENSPSVCQQTSGPSKVLD
jgi:hypothetical protein